MDRKGPRIKVSKSGPYIVTGSVPLEKETAVRDRKGIPEEWRKVGAYPEKSAYSLCRCGRSGDAPYCDGTHAKAGFVGEERADRRSYAERADLFKGPGVDLTDVRDLCMGAQFCHRGGGIRKLVAASDDEAKSDLAVEVAGQCPSGRLVTCQKDGTPIEPDLPKSIAVTEDPGRGVSGPLWVKGGILIESGDGTIYEVRNRVTLCRCGRSDSMPLCDGTHVTMGFKADDDRHLKRARDGPG